MQIEKREEGQTGTISFESQYGRSENASFMAAPNKGPPLLEREVRRGKKREIVSTLREMRELGT